MIVSKYITKDVKAQIVRIGSQPWMWSVTTMFAFGAHVIALLPVIITNMTWKFIEIPQINGWLFLICLLIIAFAASMWTQSIQYEIFCIKRSLMNDQEAKKNWNFSFVLHLMPFYVSHESQKYTEIRDSILYHHMDCCSSVIMTIACAFIVTITDYILNLKMIFAIVTAYVIFGVFVFGTSGLFLAVRSFNYFTFQEANKNEL